jgi:tetratricopeptide (TPR) repeat protein
MSKRFNWIFLLITFYLFSCSEPINWLERAKTEYQQEDYLGAIVALNAQLTDSDTSCEALYLRGSSFRRIQKWQFASADLKRAEQMYPECIEARIELARVLFDSGDTAATKLQLNRLQHIKGKPGSEIQIEYALLAYRQDRFHEALLHLDNAIAYDSSSYLAWYYRGYLQSRFTDDDHSAGTRIMELFDFDKSLHDFTRSLALDPQFADAWYLRGIVYLNRRNHTSGLADLERAIKLEPSNSYYYTGRAEYYLREKNFEAAKKDLEKAIQLNFNDTLSKQLLKRSVDSLNNKFN